MTKPIFFIIGPQGSGKGTQLRILAQKLGYFAWDMGAILREEREYALSDGKKVKDIIDQGSFLSDAQLFEVVKKRIGEIPAEQGIIFEGVPRSVGQAQFLVEYAHSLGCETVTVLHIDVTREETMKRLMLRAEKEHRADDTPEAIEKRLKWTESFMTPMLEYLSGHAKVIKIDGGPPIEEVTKAIDTALGLAS